MYDNPLIEWINKDLLTHKQITRKMTYYGRLGHILGIIGACWIFSLGEEFAFNRVFYRIEDYFVKQLLSILFGIVVFLPTKVLLSQLTRQLFYAHAIAISSYERSLDHDRWRIITKKGIITIIALVSGIPTGYLALKYYSKLGTLSIPLVISAFITRSVAGGWAIGKIISAVKNFIHYYILKFGLSKKKEPLWQMRILLTYMRQNVQNFDETMAEKVYVLLTNQKIRLGHKMGIVFSKKYTTNHFSENVYTRKKTFISVAMGCIASFGMTVLMYPLSKNMIFRLEHVLSIRMTPANICRVALAISFISTPLFIYVATANAQRWYDFFVNLRTKRSKPQIKSIIIATFLAGTSAVMQAEMNLGLITHSNVLNSIGLLCSILSIYAANFWPIETWLTEGFDDRIYKKNLLNMIDKATTKLDELSENNYRDLKQLIVNINKVSSDV